MYISSKDNTNVKLYIKLSGSKKARKDHSMFVLEGLRLVADALKENAKIEYVLVSQSKLSAFEEEISGFSEQLDEAKILTISEEVSKKLSDTKSSQGVFAICAKLDKIDSTDKILSGTKILILNRIQDPGNLGTIIRTADALGIRTVFLTNDCCDLYNPKVVRSTMGSLFRMNIYDEFEYADVIAMLKQNSVKTFASVVDSDAKSLVECDFSGACAVVIGNEGNGLDEEAVRMCDEKLTIKMQGNINSMNAATASSIIMWEMFR